jgi:hypothetical protein
MGAMLRRVPAVIEPKLPAQAQRYGADLPLLDWADRLVCSRCGSREVDSIVRPRSHGGVDDARVPLQGYLGDTYSGDPGGDHQPK